MPPQPQTNRTVQCLCTYFSMFHPTLSLHVSHLSHSPLAACLPLSSSLTSPRPTHSTHVSFTRLSPCPSAWASSHITKLTLVLSYVIYMYRHFKYTREISVFCFVRGERLERERGVRIKHYPLSLVQTLQILFCACVCFFIYLFPQITNPNYLIFIFFSFFF